MRKPVIAVVPLWDETKSSIWMLPNYLDAITSAGGIPITLPLKANKEDIIQICEMCDGVLLTGGHDVNPAIYGEARNERCGEPCNERDEMERVILEYVIERDMPALGICRGIQIINALCGGSLYQDLPTQYQRPNRANHQMTPPYDRVCHKVTILEDTPLFETIGGCCELGVNSYHHQAIKELSPEVKAMAISEDGLIEAIYMPNKRFIQAVQWHPELNFHCEVSSRQIIKEFINASSQRP